MFNTEKKVVEDAIYTIRNTDQQDDDLVEMSEREQSYLEEGNVGEDKKEILSLMFDDTFIKAETSPFKTYPDDKQEFIGRIKYVDLGKVIQQYRNGEIDERMLHILDIVVHHGYINTRQIWQMYLLKFRSYIKRINLKKLLNRMAEKGLVVEFVIDSSIGNTNYHIYCADYNGVRLYTALTSESVNWKRTDILQKSYIIKRSLAKNQFLIAYLKYYDVEYKLQPKLMWNDEKGHETAVVPAMQLTFMLKEQLDSIVFLVEVIRTYKGWEEDYSKKLIRYGQYMKSVEDTQALRKYYIIVCAETPEQVKEAAQLFYELQHIKKIAELRNIKLFYTYDLELLDTHFEKSLLDNLRSLEYSYEKKAWGECRLDFDFQKRDWHSIEFEIEKVQVEEKSNVIEEFCGEELLADKRKLSVQIYKIVEMQGWKFPQSITRLAIPLKMLGVDYKAMGYKRLKELFEDISKFYTIYHTSPTEMMVDCTEELKSSLKNTDSEKKNENQEIEYDYEDSISGIETKNNRGKKDIVIDYFANGILNNREWRKSLLNDIYCFRNLEKSVALLTKMTHVYDLNQDGWLNILAFSYCRAKSEKRVKQNLSGTYICFNTGLLTFNNEKIYLLAKKNYREKPEWILEGLSTVNSKVLGKILKKEFKL